jgi:hypothetical protein
VTLRCAVLHHLVASGHPLAVLGTRSTHLSADRARALVEVRSAEHEIGAGLADFCAVEQEANVRRVGVLPAQFQAVTHGCEADVVASSTLIDTLLQLS